MSAGVFKKLCAMAAGTALAVGLAACSSSGGGSGGGGGTASGSTIKIGYLSDLTGVASSAYVTSEKGVKAYLDQLNASGGVNGHKIEYVMGDTTSTTTGALTAAQKLVETDHVFAIVENSAFFYGAEAYLLKNNIPVVGSAVDGPIWTDPKNTNLFPATGPTNSEYMLTAQGAYMKRQGATKCGAISYASSISSQNAATGFVKSCEAAGLQGGYLNNQVPFGSTDVGPIALAIKNSHTDGIYLPIVPNTAFALIGALHQLGVHLKSVMLATGYGGDLLASKAAIEAGQGVDFVPTSVPVEANTPATRRQVAALAKVGVHGPPTNAEQYAFLTLTLFATGLKAAGPNPTQASLITALRHLKNYDADGLLAPNKIDFSNYTPQSRCFWVVRLEGRTFHVVPGSPFCGKDEKFK